jgi:methylated-DNA-[protein]-cysteine S-methyltransferase
MAALAGVRRTALLDKFGDTIMTSYSILKTAQLGELLLVANATQLVGVYFVDCEHTPAIQADWELNPRQSVLRAAQKQLQNYLKGTQQTFSLALHSPGTAFQREVWRQIGLIPFGQTISYSDLAQRAGAPRAIRAAGTATGRNPLSIIVPCHRVVGKHGSLGGYAGGLERKRRLLAVELDGNNGRR